MEIAEQAWRQDMRWLQGLEPFFLRTPRPWANEGIVPADRPQPHFPDALAHREDTRDHSVGLYHEALYVGLTKAQPDIEILARNLVVRGGGQTAGEFDLLYRDAQGRVVHCELAFKLYLQIERRADWKAFVGPSKHDRLDLKVHHLLDRQLRLGDHIASERALAKRGIDRIDKRAFWLTGILFHRIGTQPIAPEGTNPGYPSGVWMTGSEARAAEWEGAWRRMRKPYWFSGDPAPQVFSGTTLDRLFAPDALTSPVFFAREDCVSSYRGRRFVVPDSWPPQC